MNLLHATKQESYHFRAVRSMTELSVEWPGLTDRKTRMSDTQSTKEAVGAAALSRPALVRATNVQTFRGTP